MAVMFAQRVWVLMDKQRKVILKGVPKNRWIVQVDDPSDRKRIITYPSRGYAESAQYAGFICTTDGVDEYLYREYDAGQVRIDGVWKRGSRIVESCLEPVEMIMVYTEVEHES